MESARQIPVARAAQQLALALTRRWVRAIPLSVGNEAPGGHVTLLKSLKEEANPGAVPGRMVPGLAGNAINPRRKEFGFTLYERAPRSGSPFRASDAPLEPEDETLYLRRPQRHLYYGP